MQNDPSLLSRRLLLGAAAASGFYVAAGMKFAFAAVPDDRRLVVILLRGAMDGLNVIVPYADPAYAAARRQLALAPGNGATKLDSLFAVHDALPFFASEYASGQALAIHAVATPYRDRSHFDAQNLMETGGTRPYALQSGWLNRAVSALPQADASTAVAVASAMPTVLIGPAKTGSYSPAKLPDVPPDTASRILRMYAPDPQLAAAFSEAEVLKALADDALADTPAMAGDSGQGGKYGAGLTATAISAAELMRAPTGPRIIVLERGGWDTHANQPGVLKIGLTDLNGALAALKTGLGPLWAKTTVLCITEFGRTVALNGTNGTDHGTGSATLLLGGSVRGGRVLADWPGLTASSLYEGRDLRPTTDMRAIIAGVLQGQLGLSESALMTTVFPDSAGLVPKADLLRT
jgi:uncharacterized protein (DUF1501 family)